jgi:hypothetical protein
MYTQWSWLGSLDFVPLNAYSLCVPALFWHRAEVLLVRPLRTGDCNPAWCLEAPPFGGAFAFLGAEPLTA